MAIPASTSTVDSGPNRESSVSAVAWTAIVGGAFAAAALSLLLFILGSGLGLSSVSPWSNTGASAGALTAGAAIWLIVVQWISSGLGGYLTGRLRTKWANMHTDEVFFRDTAHGFLSWAVATVVVAALAASAASTVVTGAASTTKDLATAAVTGASQGAAQSGVDPTAYYTDALFRSDRPAPNASDQDVKGEAGRILAMGARNGSLSDGDKAYLAQLVSARTGMPQDAAEKRVNDVIGQAQAAAQKARETADQARKVTARTSFFLFFSMLVGAFIASAAAALGGRHRDEL
jgi:hypothetical protein